MRRVVWFSCGAASAVAAKLAVEKYGDGCTVVYCDTSGDERVFLDEIPNDLEAPDDDIECGPVCQMALPLEPA